jgi:MFS family permease
VTFAGAAGAVLATAASVGAMVALVLFDHWGERPPLYRATIAGLGAAAAAVVLLLIAGAPGLAGTLGRWAVVIGAAASGIAAGGGLYLVEQRMRKREPVRSGTVEGDFGGRVPPGNEK